MISNTSPEGIVRVNHSSHVISSPCSVMLMEFVSSLRLVEDPIIFIIDIEVEDIVVHNTVYELTFFLVPTEVIFSSE